jgi:hypothetical protein
MGHIPEEWRRSVTDNSQLSIGKRQCLLGQIGNIII